MATKNPRTKFWLVEHGREARLSRVPASPPARSTGVDLLQPMDAPAGAVVLVLGHHPGTKLQGLGAAPLSVLALAPATAEETAETTQVPVTLTPAGRLALTHQ